MQEVAVRSAPSAPTEPMFSGSLARDADAASKFCSAVEAALQAKGAREDEIADRDDSAAERVIGRFVAHDEEAFRRHRASMVD